MKAELQCRAQPLPRLMAVEAEVRELIMRGGLREDVARVKSKASLKMNFRERIFKQELVGS